MPGMGLTNYPNQYEVNKSDEEKVNDKNKLDKQQHVLLQGPTTTPNVNNATALSNIMELYRKNYPKDSDKEEFTGGNPNGDLDVDLSNTNPKDGWGRLDESDKGSGNSTSTTTTPVTKPKPKVKAKSSGFQKKATTLVENNDGKTKEWYESLANSSYANNKEYEADMKAYREMQTNKDGKSKAWYENLANSSYANDKEYEADMKAYRKMQADEIAKNGYYTDSQGVKVYAKSLTDKPQKKSEHE